MLQLKYIIGIIIFIILFIFIFNIDIFINTDKSEHFSDINYHKDNDMNVIYPRNEEITV